MAEPTPRMRQIEALLADDPHDEFLRYGLAMEHAGQGDEATAVSQLLALTDDRPYVPAFLQAGQMLARLGREPEAIDVLKRGIVVAKQQNDTHAAGEMEGFLAGLA